MIKTTDFLNIFRKSMKECKKYGIFKEISKINIVFN